MEYCNLVYSFILKENRAYTDNLDYDPLELCEMLENEGFDEVYIEEISNNDKEHDDNINIIKDIATKTDIRILLGGNVKRLEDVKKYLYAGAKMAVLKMDNDANKDMIIEASERFGFDKVALLFENNDFSIINEKLGEKMNDAKKNLIITRNKVNDDELSKINKDYEFLILDNNITKGNINDYFNVNVYGVSSNALVKNIDDVMNVKISLQEKNIKTNIFKSKISFSEFKTDDKGLIPVVVQEYKNNQVLMVAYMNEEAFNETIKTGKMTYFSRSRNSLWVKGETSGHFQYVKSLKIDCDKDTILAKVKQVGVACHTGSYSCFFNDLVEKEYDNTNPLMVFEEVYDVIKDRKINPKEGSYTNYLYDKGIDKILKKLGEEATEIIIAAKNPDNNEVIYEMSDFLYHMMVLMAEKGVSWEEVTRELARR